MTSRSILMAAAGSSTGTTYVDDVFSTYLYTGTGATQTITNGIDLSGGQPTTDQVAFTTPGTYAWICPPGVTSVSVVCVGGGGQINSFSGGGGGGLGYKNNISVTPGNSYTVVVGGPGSASYFISTGTVRGGGGGSGLSGTAGAGGTYTGDGGGNGGDGGNNEVQTYYGGGGGAGGYSGNGGNGQGFSLPFTSGSGGGGAGGGGSNTAGVQTGGGGVGILGQGTSGASVSQGGSGGTNGVNSTPSGGLYGGGGYGNDGGGNTGGAVRIIYPGNTRSFPSTNTGDVTPTGGNSSKGGMVLFKGRSGATDWAAYDTARGVYKELVTNSTAAQTTQYTGLLSFNSNGFTTGSLSKLNTNTSIYGSWSFAKSPKFFDVVTWTGDNTTRNIFHSLGITPGMIVVKRTDSASTQGWVVWHTSTGGTNNLLLNTTAAAAPLVNGRISAATANYFTVQSGSTNIADVNATGGTYVAYLFAHDTATDGLIQCGSYTGNGGTNGITLGYEPQWLLIKAASGPFAVQSWLLMDIMRGLLGVEGQDARRLFPNASSAENGASTCRITSTGFQVSGSADEINNSSNTYIYVAIRRPNKPPTVGTQVFQPTVYTGTNVNNRLVNTTIAPDLAIARQRNDAVLAGSVVGDRLRGQPYLLTGSTAAEVTSATALDQQIVSATEYGTAFSSMSGFYVGTDATAKLNVNTTANNHVAWAFKRAPGFFDMVCYTGTGVTGQTVSHNLTVPPEFAIFKLRGAAGSDWWVWLNGGQAATGGINGLRVNGGVSTALNVGYGTLYNIFTSAPTSSALSVKSTGSDAQSMNVLNSLYVAYLFATLPGISKVGSYTGNGSSQTINCGFTTGARFVLIKRTDATGDWYVWDSARGIVAGNDPYLAWNSTAAEVTTNDTVDADNSGFIVNQLAATNANVTSATYIFLAIA